MTETGFRYFIEALQAQKELTQPKSKPIQAGPAVIPFLPPPTASPAAPAPLPSAEPLLPPPPIPSSPSLPPDEDYTGSVCLLHKMTPKTPAYEEVLLDIEDFENLQDMSWRIDRWGVNKEKYCVSKDCTQIGRYILNAPAGKVVDHIRSERTLDNRRNNLRIATQGQHQVNTRRQKNGTSRYKGVQQTPTTGKWFVHCGPRNNRIYVGGFDTEVEAARAYNRIATQLYGSMAYLNQV